MKELKLQPIGKESYTLQGCQHEDMLLRTYTSTGENVEGVEVSCEMEEYQCQVLGCGSRQVKRK